MVNCKLNKELLIIKLLYFFELAVVSSLFIYLPQFMVEWGITKSELALINFVENILSFFSRPFFGFLVDKYQKYKELLIFLSSSCFVLFLLHLAVPKLPLKAISYKSTSTYNINLLNNANELLLCNTIFPSTSKICWPQVLHNCSLINGTQNGLASLANISCAKYNVTQQYNTLSAHFQHTLLQKFNGSDSTFSSITCASMTTYCNNSCIETPIESVFPKNIKYTFSTTFWLLAVFKIIGFALFQPLLSLTDSITFVTLGDANSKKFGFNRMFGTFGVLVFSGVSALFLFLMCFIASKESWPSVTLVQNYSQFTGGFILAALMFISLIIVALFLKSGRQIRTNTSLKSVKLLIKNWETAVFFLYTMLGGSIAQMMMQYYFIVVFSLFPTIPKYVPGLLSVVMTSSESLFFGISGKIIHKFNYDIIILITFISWCLRFLCYSFVNSYWILLVIELFNGPSFGLMLAVMMHRASKYGNDSTMGRVQGLFSGVFFNIGGAVGGLLGGTIIEFFGVNMFFVFNCILSLASGVTYIIFRFFINRFCNPDKDEPHTNTVNGDPTSVPLVPTGASGDDSTTNS